MLELRGVSAGYGAASVLREISLRLHAGELLAVVGPNGCGKSTLLRVMGGLLPAKQGQVLLQGQPLATLPRRAAARQIAFFAQSRTPADMTAGKLALHGRFPYRSPLGDYGAEDRRLAREALAQTGAAEHAGRLLATLSGGQRQSAYLAMLLAQQAQVLLVDEPTAFLDIARGHETLRLLRRQAAAGRAVVLVSHDLPQVLRAADRLAVMQDGRLLACDTPDAIYADGLLERVFNVRLLRFESAAGAHYCVEEAT